MNRLFAAALGERAGRILAAGGSAQVIGSTSRGLFLVNPSGEVVFISYESWRGPLTINLAASTTGLTYLKSSFPFSRVQQGDEVQFQADLVRFLSAEIKIQTGQIAGWTAPVPLTIENEGLSERLKTIANLVRESGRNKGWAALMPAWVDQDAAENLPGFLAEIRTLISQIRISLENEDGAGVISGITQLLGKGDGLTPSGDDLVIGLLLASGRYPELCHPILQQESLRQTAASLARKKTTWLGASLIESAQQGQADERLVSSLDGVVSGLPEPGEAASLLQAYGSSSGGDAFIGISTAIK